MTRLGLGPVLFALILVLDQVSKQFALVWLGDGRVVELAGFFNLVLVWNPGISFGMLNSVPGWGRQLLVPATLLIILLLALWLRREPRRLPRLALWAVLAGALGNLVDRLRFGAVVDFLDLHAAGYHWPTFNLADSAIVVGALLLVLDGLLLSRPAPGPAQHKG